MINRMPISFIINLMTHLWHDRAVFHFMVKEEQQAQYLQNVRHALKPNGVLIISTFAEDGPTQCSGLPVERYSVE